MSSRVRSIFSAYSQVGLCYLMHIFLVIICAALVVVAAYHWEHGFNRPFSTTGQTIMITVSTIVAQTFSIVSTFQSLPCRKWAQSDCFDLQLYLAGLVLVTQRLALVRNLRKRQTLTAVHDKASAWLGLGSSISALLDQAEVRAAMPGVVLVMLYLAGIAALHVTVPASIEVNTYNAVEVVRRVTQLARPHDVAG